MPEDKKTEETPDSVEPDKELDTVKRVAFIVKIIAAIIVFLFIAVLVYMLYPRSPSGTISYNSDLEKLYAGRKSMNVGMCESIDNKDVKNTCIMNVAENRMDAGICAQISDKNVRQICMYRVVKKTKDKKLCEEMENPTIKEECLKL